MDGVADELLLAAARELKGYQRRVFLGKVCRLLCEESPRKTEVRFGWGRETVAQGLRELRSNQPELTKSSGLRRGRPRSEAKNPQMSIDIRLIVEPHTHSDPELKTSRQYTNLSAAEVREALLNKGYKKTELPSERTIRDTGNLRGYESESQFGRIRLGGEKHELTAKAKSPKAGIMILRRKRSWFPLAF